MLEEHTCPFLLWLLWREDITFQPRPAWMAILLFYASSCSWDGTTAPSFLNFTWGVTNFFASAVLEPWSSSCQTFVYETLYTDKHLKILPIFLNTYSTSTPVHSLILFKPCEAQGDSICNWRPERRSRLPVLCSFSLSSRCHALPFSAGTFLKRTWTLFCLLSDIFCHLYNRAFQDSLTSSSQLPSSVSIIFSVISAFTQFTQIDTKPWLCSKGSGNSTSFFVS